MTLGDSSLERQVLSIFAAQTDSLLSAIAGLPADTGPLAHKLKGSARAIGAFRLADVACALEAVLREGGDPSRALADLEIAGAEALSAIASILRRP